MLIYSIFKLNVLLNFYLIRFDDFLNFKIQFKLINIIKYIYGQIKEMFILS